MIGTFVNMGTILMGSLIGSVPKKLLNERLNQALLDAMGFAAFGIGINSIVQNMPKSQYPVLFIVSLAIGCLIGTLLRLDERIKGITSRTEGGSHLGHGLITGCLVFCIGTLSILGPVKAALEGDHTLLFTNASLDLVTSMVLATTYGIGMAIAAIVLFLWQGSMYGLSRLVGGFRTDTLLTELSIVGGFLIAMSGLSIMRIKEFRTLDYLPALLVPVVWCLIGV